MPICKKENLIFGKWRLSVNFDIHNNTRKSMRKIKKDLKQFIVDNTNITKEDLNIIIKEVRGI